MEAYTLQDQLQVSNILKHLRVDEILANDILVTLDLVQLLSGYITQVMEDTVPRLDYIDQGLLTRLWKRLGEINTSIWIKKPWVPKLQQENNVALVQTYVGIPGATRG